MNIEESISLLRLKTMGDKRLEEAANNVLEELKKFQGKADKLEIALTFSKAKLYDLLHPCDVVSDIVMKARLKDMEDEIEKLSKQVRCFQNRDVCRVT